MKHALSVTRQQNFAAWYQEVISEADLAEESGVRGCMVIRPWGYGMWERIQKLLDAQIKAAGVDNCYFPLFIPLSFFEKEADQAAVTILQRVGYDRNSLVEMLQAMETLLKPDGKDFAKTHPSPESRMAELEETIGAYQPVQASPVTQKRFNAALKKI